jgi:hypothetical protein
MRCYFVNAWGLTEKYVDMNLRINQTSDLLAIISFIFVNNLRVLHATIPSLGA